MKRVFSFPFSLVLFVLLFGVVPGCSKSSNESEQTGEQPQNSVDYSMAQPVEVPMLKSEKEFKDFIASCEIAVVKFGATWCGPCCELSPELCKQAGYFETENVKYAEVDVDSLDALATSLKVGSIPDVRVYYEGRPYTQIVGNYPYEIANLVNSLCANKRAASPAGQEATETQNEQDSQTSGAEKPEDDVLPMLTSEESFRNFVKDNRFAVVKFGADWCPPCRKLIPELRKQAEYYKDANVKFAEVDVDALPKLSEEFKIDAIPLVQVYKDGTLQNSVVGYDPDGIAKEISNVCQKEPPMSAVVDDDKPLEDELWPEDANSDETEKDAK